MQMWVSIASDATCAAALQQAVVDFGVVDTDTLQAVLQIPETAAGLARALCTALQAAPPAAELAPCGPRFTSTVATRSVGLVAHPGLLLQAGVFQQDSRDTTY